MCVGQKIVFTCKQNTTHFSRWTIFLNRTYNFSNPTSQTGILTFIEDPGFGFEIYVSDQNSGRSDISELRVTAVEQLNGVTVECRAQAINSVFTSTIQIASVPSKYCAHTII